MRFLIPDAGGVIERQIITGLKDIGQEATGCFFYPYGTNDREAMRKIMDEKGIEAVLGFADDACSSLLEICGEYDVPLLLWHLDAPYDYIHPAYRQKYGHVYHFCMDRYYVDILRQLGYENVSYLPLGTTAEIFRPIAHCAIASEVGFVAKLEIMRAKTVWDSLTDGWQGRDEDYLLIKKLIDVSCESGIDVAATIQVFLLRGFDLSVTLHIIHFLETIAIQHRRRKPAEALRDLCTLRVVGDHWDYTNIYPHQIRPRLNYYTELPEFYCSSMINLNVTQPQVKAGLNQRFFDIPACGSFLISDRNEEAGKWFIPGEEIIMYDDIPDLIDKVRYYREHPEERERIIMAGMEKVLSCHTMKHRMENVVNVLTPVKSERALI